jgi:hypothetical protein
MGGERIKENDGRVNLTVIHLLYCKDFCIWHSVLPE